MEAIELAWVLNFLGTELIITPTIVGKINPPQKSKNHKSATNEAKVEAKGIVDANAKHTKEPAVAMIKAVTLIYPPK
jgi:hypothetical protein